ncbi:MAG TPA: PHP domain-containing protein, partial [Candidatus Bathyarchaeia archaeon]
MAIDLHIHSRSSDGALTVEQIFREAEKRRITFLSITDHDSIGCQEVAVDLSENAKIGYVTGVELNVTFSHHGYREAKPISLDFLGYQFDPTNDEMKIKLQQMAAYREKRAAKILENLNAEFGKEGITALSKE